VRGELSGEQTPIPETAATQREEQARRRRTNVPPVEDWQTVFMPHAHFYYPQVGDCVVYLMQGHEAYLGKYPEEGGTFLPATCDGRTFLVRRVEYRIGVHVRYALLTLVLLPENDDASKSAPSCPFPLPPCRIARARARITPGRCLATSPRGQSPSCARTLSRSRSGGDCARVGAGGSARLATGRGPSA
jgi:hypothetical protein